MGDQAPLTRTIDTAVPAQGTAGTAQDFIGGEAPFDGEVTAVTITPEATITGVASNHRKIALVNKGADGSGTTEIASITFANGTNAAAFDEKALTLSVVEGATEVEEGDQLLIVETIVGTGMTHSGYRAQVTIARG
jgi:hypothetical protein